MFDSLVISLLDSDAQKGIFKKELAKTLNIPVTHLGDMWIETEITNGVIQQYLYVQYNDKIDKDNLMEVDFESIRNSCIVFEIGDTIL